jgi:hypothetical protein
MNQAVRDRQYEDLRENTLGEMQRLAGFLEIGLEQSLLGDIAARYDPANHAEFGTRGLHFNIGRSSRYLADMDQDCLDLCNRRFESFLLKMDYPLP